MTTAQVVLSETESQATKALSRSSGRTQEELLHDAVEQFLTQHAIESHLTALRRGRGIWQDWQDFSPLSELRKEWDRV